MMEDVVEYARTFEVRLKKQLRAPSPINDDANTSGHHTKSDSFSIVGRELHALARSIKEAMYIKG